jgi:hypothetical protein
MPTQPPAEEPPAGANSPQSAPTREPKNISGLAAVFLALASLFGGYIGGNVLPINRSPDRCQECLIVVPAKPDAEKANQSTFERILKRARQAKASAEDAAQRISNTFERAGATVTPELKEKILKIATDVVKATSDEQVQDAAEALVELLDNVIKPGPTPTPKPSPTPIIRVR